MFSHRFDAQKLGYAKIILYTVVLVFSRDPRLSFSLSSARWTVTYFFKSLSDPRGQSSNLVAPTFKNLETYNGITDYQISDICKMYGYVIKVEKKVFNHQACFAITVRQYAYLKLRAILLF